MKKVILVCLMVIGFNVVTEARTTHSYNALGMRYTETY